MKISSISDLRTLYAKPNQRAEQKVLKAFMCSKLWDKSTQIDRNSFPTMGEMLKDHLKLDEEPESREEMLKRYQKDI